MKKQIDPSFQITTKMREWADIKAPTVDIDLETENFIDYWMAHGKPMADWTRTWQMWMRRAPNMGGALKTWQTEISRYTTAVDPGTVSREDEQRKWAENMKALQEMKSPLKLVKK